MCSQVQLLMWQFVCHFLLDVQFDNHAGKKEELSPAAQGSYLLTCSLMVSLFPVYHFLSCTFVCCASCHCCICYFFFICGFSFHFSPCMHCFSIPLVEDFLFLVLSPLSLSLPLTALLPAPRHPPPSLPKPLCSHGPCM